MDRMQEVNKYSISTEAGTFEITVEAGNFEKGSLYEYVIPKEILGQTIFDHVTLGKNEGNRIAILALIHCLPDGVVLAEQISVSIQEKPKEEGEKSGTKKKYFITNFSNFIGNCAADFPIDG